MAVTTFIIQLDIVFSDNNFAFLRRKLNNYITDKQMNIVLRVCILQFNSSITVTHSAQYIIINSSWQPFCGNATQWSVFVLCLECHYFKKCSFENG